MLYLSAEGEPVELTINKNRADLFSLSYDAPNDPGVSASSRPGQSHKIIIAS